jgi:hypothetical protein
VTGTPCCAGAQFAPHCCRRDLKTIRYQDPFHRACHLKVNPGCLHRRDSCHPPKPYRRKETEVGLSKRGQRWGGLNVCPACTNAGRQLIPLPATQRFRLVMAVLERKDESRQPRYCESNRPSGNGNCLPLVEWVGLDSDSTLN